MSLETPDKIRSLQRRLYHKAKTEPEFPFYLLYDKICREDSVESRRRRESTIVRRRSKSASAAKQRS